MEWIKPFFSSEDFAPHGYCLMWDPRLVWTHIVSDATIMLAYFSIPLVLGIIARRRPDLNQHGILFAFAAFIVMCGITHLAGIVTMWMPIYGIEAGLKAITAIVSVVTAVLIWRILNSVLNAPHMDALTRANSELVALNAELEERVRERTKALQDANEILLKTAIEAREGERVKHDFLARVSHELRTPLNAIIGFTDLMRSGISGQLSRKHMEYCENVHGAALHLLDEINDVLDLERLSDPAYRLTPEPVDLHAEVEQIVRLNQSASGFSRVSVIVDVPKPFEIQVDRRSIVTLLSNLVSNAIKYSPRGGKVDIKARRVRSSDEIEIKVIDRGVGIPENRLEEIFNPFVRVHETDLPTVGGTGLGLSIVRMLTEMHGGTVSAESALGEGTTVTVLLPDDPTSAIAMSAGSDVLGQQRRALQGFGVHDPEPGVAGMHAGVTAIRSPG